MCSEQGKRVRELGEKQIEKSKLVQGAPCKIESFDFHQIESVYRKDIRQLVTLNERETKSEIRAANSEKIFQLYVSCNYSKYRNIKFYVQIFSV